MNKKYLPTKITETRYTSFVSLIKVKYEIMFMMPKFDIKLEYYIRIVSSLNPIPVPFLRNREKKIFFDSIKEYIIYYIFFGFTLRLYFIRVIRCPDFNSYVLILIVMSHLQLISLYCTTFPVLFYFI